MSKMKRLLKLLAVYLILTLLLAACHKQVNGESQNSSSSADTTAQTEESSQTTAQSAEGSKSPEQSIGAPVTTTVRQTVRVTVKEGESLTQIFKKLEQSKVCSFSSLMDTAAKYDFSYYSLIGAISADSHRCFKLEGYLFPNTYDFYIGEKPEDVIGKFLRNGDGKITAAMRNTAAARGRSMDEILTVASIIQREGSKMGEVSNVAAVIYNRIKAGQKLQMDSTIDYIEKNVKPYLTGDINRYNSYYNTYKCSALPAGPISNPGMSTINAALNPSNVSYLFFCHDAAGNYYYANTYEEHQANLKKAGLSS